MFLYFFPECHSIPSGAVLKSMGLESRLKKRGSNNMKVSGPGGKSGIVVAAIGAGVAGPVYNKDSQTWRECEGGKYWLGFENDDKPTPESLECDQVYCDLLLPLGDGNMWGIPNQKVLPKWIDVDAVGKRVERPCEANADFAARVEKVAAFYYAEKDTIERDFDEDFIWQLAMDALAVNYNISSYEIAALKLLTDQFVFNIILTIIDHPAIQPPGEEVKKKDV